MWRALEQRVGALDDSLRVAPRQEQVRNRRRRGQPTARDLDLLDGWRDEASRLSGAPGPTTRHRPTLWTSTVVWAILAERLEGLGFTLRRSRRASRRPPSSRKAGDWSQAPQPTRRKKRRHPPPRRNPRCAHSSPLDTVFLLRTAILAEVWAFLIDGHGRAWGPCVYDMKGGLAGVPALRSARAAHIEAAPTPPVRYDVCRFGLQLGLGGGSHRLSAGIERGADWRISVGSSSRLARAASRHGAQVAGTFPLYPSARLPTPCSSPIWALMRPIWDLAQKVAALHR